MFRNFKDDTNNVGWIPACPLGRSPLRDGVCRAGRPTRPRQNAYRAGERIHPGGQALNPPYANIREKVAAVAC